MNSSLKLIAGDASDRKFYRHLSPDGQSLAVCMHFPEWEGGYGGDPESWLEIHAVLNSFNVPVPEIYKVDQSACQIWTEDLGDHLLSVSLKKNVLDVDDKDCNETIEQYKQALDLLLQVQYGETALEHKALNRYFDFEKLYQEMLFFVEHYLNGLLNLNVSKETHPVLFQDLENLCKQLDACDRVFCHRDYHVRNLMLKNDKIYWIDFQDARMGPHTYDVASLLRDSYVDINWKTRKQLFDYYYFNLSKKREELNLSVFEKEECYEEFQLIGLQRNLKALGSFGYLATQKNKKSYLEYIPRTLGILCSKEALRFENDHHNQSLNECFPTLFELLFEIQSEKIKE